MEGNAWLEEEAASSLSSSFSLAHASPCSACLPASLPPNPDHSAEVAIPVSIYFLTSSCSSVLMKSWYHRGWENNECVLRKTRRLCLQRRREAPAAAHVPPGRRHLFAKSGTSQRFFPFEEQGPRDSGFPWAIPQVILNFFSVTKSRLFQRKSQISSSYIWFPASLCKQKNAQHT